MSETTKGLDVEAIESTIAVLRGPKILPDASVEALLWHLVREDVPALCRRLRELEAALEALGISMQAAREAMWREYESVCGLTPTALSPSPEATRHE